MTVTNFPRGSLLIESARLIDGTGALPQERTSILISDGRITEIGRDVPGQNVQKLDAEGLTVLPGLIDSHVHLRSVPGAAHRGDSEDVRRQFHSVHLRAYLACGVTTVVDAGSSFAEARMFDGWLRAGHPGPEILFLLPVFLAPDGYMASEGTVEEVDMAPVASPQDVQDHFLQSEGLNPVGVKVLLESGFGFNRWPIHSPEMRKAIREAAARRGLPLYIHSWIEQDGLAALDMEPHALAHSNGIVSEEMVARIKAQSVYVTTTSSIPDAFGIHQQPERLDDPLVRLAVPQIELATASQPEAWDKLRRGMAEMYTPADASSDEIEALAEQWMADIPGGVEQQTARVRQLHEAGVPVAVGTDSGLWPLVPYFFHGPTTLREIELLGQSGFFAMAAIQAATLVPARMLGLAETLGTVEVGKRADMVIVRGDPLQDLRDLRTIEWTVQRGIAKSPQEWMESQPLEP